MRLNIRKSIKKNKRKHIPSMLLLQLNKPFPSSLKSLNINSVL